MNDFEEYIRQVEPHKREKGYAWQTAIGLQAVDGLKTSTYLMDTARQHIEGDITIDEVKHLIDSYYKFGEHHELKNRYLLIGEKEENKVESAISAISDDSKCNICTLNCTLEEMAVLKILREKPDTGK